MIQLDFFDMQEDQERKWEEKKKQNEAMRAADMFNTSVAEVRAMGTQTDRPARGSTRSQIDQTRLVGKQSFAAGTQTDDTSQSASDAQPSCTYPLFTVYSDKYTL